MPGYAAVDREVVGFLRDMRVSVLEGLTHGATFRASLGPALAWAAAVGGLANPVREPAGEGRVAGE